MRGDDARAGLLRRIGDVAIEVNAAIDRIVGESEEAEPLYKAAKHLIKAGGKRIRPFIVVKSCELVGGDASDAFPIAASIELLHTFTLVHDDIMDQDELRRGVATVHKAWGLPTAIIAGDFLFAKVYEGIVRSSRTRPLPLGEILDRITGATVRICEGQLLDMSLEGRLDATEDDYFRMIEAKTATLFRVSAEVGGLVGGGTGDQVMRLGTYGFNAGIAFQLIDDVLGLMASEDVLKKPVGGDVREGKMTLIMIHALRHGAPQQRVRVAAALGNVDASPSEIQEVIGIARSLGSIDYATQKARLYVERARQALSAFPPSEAKRDLLDLAEFLTMRKY